MNNLTSLLNVFIGVFLALFLDRIVAHIVEVRKYNKLLEILKREILNNKEALENKNYFAISFESFKSVEGMTIFITHIKVHTHDVLWKTYSHLREYKQMKTTGKPPANEALNKDSFNDKNISVILDVVISIVEDSKIKPLKLYMKKDLSEFMKGVNLPGPLRKIVER